MYDRRQSQLGLVLSGGGARAAYQVGFLRHLAQRFPECFPTILTGVSAGAINAAYLAAHPGSFQQSVQDLSGIWQDLHTPQVFRSDMVAMGISFVRWGLRFATGGSSLVPDTRGLLDTAPLRELLGRVMTHERGVLTGIQKNIQRGRLRAIALTTTHYSTAQSVTWTQGSVLEHWHRPHRRSCPTALTLDHVMASAALPLVFPAVRVGEGWHGDGGIRLIAPLAPAIHLGADRVVAISTRHQPTYPDGCALPPANGYPPPAQVIGVLLNAIFLEMIDYDTLNLERLNSLLEEGRPHVANGLRRVELLVLRPSRDLGELAQEYAGRMPRSFRYFLRGFGAHEPSGADALSMLMFHPEYLSRLIQLGEEDAEARAAEIAEFVTGCSGIPQETSVRQREGRVPA